MWGSVIWRGGSEDQAREFVTRAYTRVPVLDAAARAATVTFSQKGLGDVHLTWENEAHLILKEFGADKFEIITPSLSILAEPPVSLVDKNARRHGTTEVAKAYLDYLYSEEGQDIAEYAVMLALIIIVCLTAVSSIGTNAKGQFTKIGNSLK